MNEIAELLEIVPVFPPGTLDCHTWLPVRLEGGAELDCCVLDGEPARSHEADAFPDDDGAERDD